MGAAVEAPLCVVGAVASPYDEEGLYSATAADIFDAVGLETEVDSVEVDFADFVFLAAACADGGLLA